MFAAWLRLLVGVVLFAAGCGSGVVVNAVCQSV